MTKEKKIEDEQNSDNFVRFIDEFENSFKTDKRFFSAEIEVNMAYCEALFQAGILNRIESDKIKNTLQTIRKRASFDKTFLENFPSDNIHSFVEARLFQLIGDTALKIKTGKSRIEQFSTVFRLWLRKEIEKISKHIASLQKSLLKICEENMDVILPGYSNLQNEHPILFAHYGLAYFEMFSRDRERLDEVWRRVNVLPLGAGKLAGTSYEIDYEEIARDLGFEGIIGNSLDAVSDRDFAVEFVNACGLIMLHLSRLSEDLILYSSEEFGFVFFKESKDSTRLSKEKFTNVLRLIKGKTGQVFGNQVALQTSLKGLPMSFNKDLQENLKTVFESADCSADCLKIASKIISKVNLNKEKTKTAATKGFYNANEIVDYLIHRGVSFGTATKKVQEIVALAESKEKRLKELDLDDFRKFSGDFELDIFEALSLEKTLESKNQIGGTSPERVFEALEIARESLARE
jgi:argininosuccinate lyase